MAGWYCQTDVDSIAEECPSAAGLINYIHGCPGRIVVCLLAPYSIVSRLIADYTLNHILHQTRRIPQKDERACHSILRSIKLRHRKGMLARKISSVAIPSTSPLTFHGTQSLLSQYLRLQGSDNHRTYHYAACPLSHARSRQMGS